jgi:hypothetical protein
MTKLIIDRDMASKLDAFQTDVELRSVEGKLLGHYAPQQDADFDTSLDISREELRRRAERRTGRPLADLLQEWEKHK